MKKLLLSIILILPFTFMSCTNKVMDKDKANEETNITENNNKPKENNEIKDDDTVKKEETPKENVEVVSPIEIFIDSRFGYLESIYLENGDYYLSLDEAEVFFDEEAITESNLDNEKLTYHKDEQRGAYFYDAYYIRNNNSTLSYFPIAKDAKFYLCAFQFMEAGGFNLYEVSLEKFIEGGTSSYNPASPSIRQRITIWADIQDGVAVKLYQQYIP